MGRARGAKRARPTSGRFEPEKNIAELEAIYRFAIEHPVWIELEGDGASARGYDRPGTASATGRLARTDRVSADTDRARTQQRRGRRQRV